MTTPHRRIAVIGVTGSGKTTFAREMRRRLCLKHVELDALHWEPNWTEAPPEIMRARVESALSCDGWVTDGNYSVVRDIVWSKAELIVWLDYSLPLILWRLTRRTFRRVFLREEMWNDNHETFRNAYMSRDSLYLWAMKSYRTRPAEYRALFALPEHAHLTVVRLRTPQEARIWLEASAPLPK